MKTIAVSPNLSVSYREAGAWNSPLVLLHAFPLSSAMWDTQLSEFSRDFQVLAPDFRGIGQTSPFGEEPSLRTLAHDLILWAEAVNVYEPVILCGLSMGGYVALEFARTYPQKLRALILCDTRADADSPDARKARDEMTEFAQTSDGRAIAQKMLPKLLEQTTLRDHPDVAQKVKQIAAPNTGENLARLIAALRDRRDSTSILPQIGVPTLVMGGSEDTVSAPDVMARMAASIPGARHVVIEGAGHLANLEKPDEFNREVRAFLREL